MPIKFRCHHCQQLLGISRVKSGEVVDCPTCGRSVRVPTPDGRREPVPKPGMNLGDARLASALGQLARIGEGPESEEAEETAPSDSARDSGSPGLEPQERSAEALTSSATAHRSADEPIIQPEPLPEPVPIEPPVPVVSGPGAGGKSSQPRRTRSDAPASNPLASQLAEAGLSSSETVPARRQGASRSRSAPSWQGGGRWFERLRRSFTFPVTLALLGCSLLAFGLGYLVGTSGGSDQPAAASGSDQSRRDESKRAAARGRKPAVHGRITYKNEQGDSRPDRGARVLVFPKQRSGTRKLDIAGFRAGDAAADFESAAAAFRSLGGDVAVVKDDGSYEVSLPSAGSYRILVLSHYQPRDSEQPIDESLLRLLSAYFDRPEQLLGRVAYRFAQVRYKGAEPVLWDHAF